MRTPAAWLRSIKRRRPGVYLYRTRRHYNPRRTEWGYVGKSRNTEIRDLCHAGKCGRHQSCLEKPWWDLKARRYVVRLPWWLGWDWLTLSLETGLILLTRPRYNIAKNPWPHLTKQEQINQRFTRDTAPEHYKTMLRLAPWLNGVRVVGLLMIITGTIGTYLWNR